MTCPKCNSRTRISDKRYNVDNNELYRRRICLNENCKYKFYSVEIDIEDNESLKKQWNDSIKGGV